MMDEILDFFFDLDVAGVVGGVVLALGWVLACLAVPVALVSPEHPLAFLAFLLSLVVAAGGILGWLVADQRIPNWRTGWSLVTVPIGFFAGLAVIGLAIMVMLAVGFVMALGELLDEVG